MTSSPPARGPESEQAGEPAAASVAAVVERALAHDKGAVSTLVGVFEDRRPTAASRRAEVLSELDRAARGPEAVVLGVTGTPGSGKSSLVARLTAHLLDEDPALSIGVVAVDPSSHLSGGSLLGDRTRLRPTSGDRRLFFRSQASATELGGLSPSSFQVCRLLARLYDIVIVETVGVGQSEADIRHLADRVYLVLQPLGGDEVQFLKAGIIEVPHAFVLNKCDEPSAAQSLNHLRSSIWLARPFDSDAVPILQTSAKTGSGVPALAADMVAARQAKHPGVTAREPYFFGRWVEEEWGRVGTRFLNHVGGGASAWLTEHGGFEGAQQAFPDALIASLVR
jgi:LAO/AO transport system kinase